MMLGLCFSLIGIGVKAANVDYSITSYEVQLDLSKGNTARFEQKVTYQFDASYNVMADIFCWGWQAICQLVLLLPKILKWWSIRMINKSLLVKSLVTLEMAIV